MLDIARGLLKRSARDRSVEIPLPTDVVVAQGVRGERRGGRASRSATSRADEMILDIGPDTAERFARMLHEAGTIVWNGRSACSSSTSSARARARWRRPSRAARRSRIAGGGDTLAAIEKYGVEDDISYISTGGGAFLEFLEGKKLPAVAVLEERARANRDQLMLRRTKIVATLGPATDNPKVLADMMRAGATWCASTSRTASAQAHAKRVEMVRVGRRAGRQVGRRARRPAGPEDPHRALRRRQGAC